MTDVVIPGIANPTPSENTRRKGPRGRVFIYPNWCKGCHICVDFCPTGVLAFTPSQAYPRVEHPEKCTACHWCDTHCPDLAIVVQALV